MDPWAFDELSRRLAEKTTRGHALKLFAGALVGTFAGAGAANANPPPKHCKFQGYTCRFNTDCCSMNCCNRTCCGNGQECCGGQCVQCPEGQSVDPETCRCEGAPSPPPPGAVCGNGVCEAGEDCTSCPQDCGPCPPTCGNGICEQPEEDCGNCPQDCGPCGVCGNGVCEPGEDCTNCPQDCGTCPGVCPVGSDSCVSTVNCSSTNPFCFCFMTTEGTSECVDTTLETCPPVPECVSSTQCPPGDVCINVAGCCGPGATICAPICTT